MIIHIEDLVANALIEKNRLDGSRKVSNIELEQYAEEVIKDLKQKNIDVKVDVSRILMKQFEEKYKDWFLTYEDDKIHEWVLGQNKLIEDLELLFRSNLPIDVILSFANVEIVQKTFSNKEENIKGKRL